jgi:hypothetical protein
MADVPAQQQELPPEARKALDNLRKSINEFHAARLHTNEVRLGLVKSKVTPEQAQQVVAAWRDPRMEEEAVQQLRAFLQMLLGREPTTSEMEAGPPPSEALGFLPVLVAVPLIVGGAATLSSLFGYMTERERRMLAEMGVGQGFWARLQGTAVQALPWVAVATGGWVALRMYQGKPIIPKLKPAALPAAAPSGVQQNPEDEDDELEDEDDEADEPELDDAGEGDEDEDEGEEEEE